jgi:hypothetical protein
MPDPFDPLEDEPAPDGSGAELCDDQENDPFPWDGDPPPHDPDAPRPRHDGFTQAKKNVFLKALVKTGCVLDACRRTRTSPTTVYRHQETDQTFYDHCELALRMSGTPMEITAWQRAVDGIEEQVVVGGKVRVRRRYSEGLLRMLLQGSNPEKYGPRPAFKRKRLLKHEKKQVEREVRAEMAAKEKNWSFDEAIEKLERQLTALDKREAPKKFAAGWTKSPDGHWIPPGYAPVPDYVAPLPPADGGETPCDSA